MSKASGRLGLPVDLLEISETYKNEGIYPDNLKTVAVFEAMLTQWRVGPGGAVGLDYNVLPWVMERKRVDDADDVFEGLRIMERAALREIRR